jgi:membrane-bound ClpP family serine protease
MKTMTKKDFNIQGILWIVTGFVQLVVLTELSQGQLSLIALMFTSFSFLLSAYFFWRAYKLEKVKKKKQRVISYTLEKKVFENPDCEKMINNKKDGN